MEALFFDDPGEFLAAIRPLSARHPARCTVVNTVLHSHIAAEFSAEPPLMVALVDDVGALAAAALQTPPYPLTVVLDPALADKRTTAAILATAILTRAPAVTAVLGPWNDVDAFLGVWPSTTGSVGHAGKRLLLHRLGEFVPPVGVIGSVRNADGASNSDSQLIARWWFEFALEAGTLPKPSAPKQEVLRERTARGHATLLWCVDGRPVAVAGAGAVVDGAVRIGPVYTPPAERGHRYGSAVTAAAVESARRRGATAVELFTDADYPTSNNIYRRLGFEQVDVFREVAVTLTAAVPASPGRGDFTPAG